MPIETLAPTETAAQTLRVVLTIGAFALAGAVHTLGGAIRNDESWQLSKGRTEIALLALVGAFAGVWSVTVGADIGGVVFGAAVAVIGIIIREFYALATASHERYGELIETGISPTEAAILTLRHGFETDNAAEIMSALHALVELGGQPLSAAVQDRADRLDDRYRTEGVSGITSELMDTTADGDEDVHVPEDDAWIGAETDSGPVLRPPPQRDDPERDRDFDRTKHDHDIITEGG
jgi:hypothetical protein